MSMCRSFLTGVTCGVALLAACTDQHLTDPASRSDDAQLAKGRAGPLKVTPARLEFTAIGARGTLTATTAASTGLLANVSGACATVTPRQVTRSPAKFTVTAATRGACTVTITDGTGASVLVPIQVNVLQRGTVVNGVFHSCGLTSAGAAYCWGRNRAGQLGNATNGGTDTPTPTPVPVQGSLVFTGLTAGSMHTCGLTAIGTAYCWGSNAVGQLGTATNSGTVALNITPLQVATTLTFLALEAGADHTCGLAADGSAHCWGYNLWGQLGTPTNAGEVTPTPLPVQVGASVTFDRIESGASHTCALTSAGAAWCWGRNNFGQLGTTLNLNTATPTTAPQRVAGHLVFASLAAGGTHTCGLTASGTAYCWGNNERGQLGTTTEYDTGIPLTAPVAVEGNLVLTRLVAGHEHTCGLVTDGSAYCWGVNMSGQLGGVTEFMFPSPTPLAVSGGQRYLALAAAGEHTCGVVASGTTYCWGSNLYGQLGSTTNSGTGLPTSAAQPVSGGLGFAMP